MRIGANHHSARECIIFKYNLVYDSGSRFPETNTIFIGYRLKKIKNFTALIQRKIKIGLSPVTGQNQVITVNTTGIFERGNMELWPGRYNASLEWTVDGTRYFTEEKLVVP